MCCSLVTKLVPSQREGKQGEFSYGLTVDRWEDEIVGIPKLHFEISICIGLPYIIKRYQIVIIGHSVYEHKFAKINSFVKWKNTLFIK